MANKKTDKPAPGKSSKPTPPSPPDDHPPGTMFRDVEGAGTPDPTGIVIGKIDPTAKVAMEPEEAKKLAMWAEDADSGPGAYRIPDNPTHRDLIKFCALLAYDLEKGTRNRLPGCWLSRNEQKALRMILSQWWEQNPAKPAEPDKQPGDGCQADHGEFQGWALEDEGLNPEVVGMRGASDELEQKARASGVQDIALAREYVAAIKQCEAVTMELAALKGYLSGFPAFRVYVADQFGKWTRARKLITLLQDAHFRITCDWTRVAEELGGVSCPPGMTKERKTQEACADAQGVREADLLILIAPEKGGAGRWVELGMALHAEKPVIVVGNIQDCVFFNNPNVLMTADLQDAYDAALHLRAEVERGYQRHTPELALQALHAMQRSVMTAGE